MLDSVHTIVKFSMSNFNAYLTTYSTYYPALYNSLTWTFYLLGLGLLPWYTWSTLLFSIPYADVDIFLITVYGL